MIVELCTPNPVLIATASSLAARTDTTGGHLELAAFWRRARAQRGTYLWNPGGAGQRGFRRAAQAMLDTAHWLQVRLAQLLGVWRTVERS